MRDARPQKAICHSIYRTCPELANPLRQEVNQWLPGVGGEGRIGTTGTWFFRGHGNVLKLDSDDGRTA